MTIPMKLLTCPVRQKAFLVKLKTYGDPASAQRGVRGSTIAFPQENALTELTTLPHKLSELARSLEIIFVGNRPPTEEQLKKIFRVESSEVLQLLHEWKDNGHPGFQHGSWNMEEIEAFEAGGGRMVDFLQHCIHTVDKSSEVEIDLAAQSYTNDDDVEMVDPDAPLPDYVPEIPSYPDFSDPDSDSDFDPSPSDDDDTMYDDICNFYDMYWKDTSVTTSLITTLTTTCGTLWFQIYLI